MIAYILVFSGLFFSLLRGREVIAPHTNTYELRRIVKHHAGRPDNRKFNDYIQNFVPDVQAQMKDARSGWLATWTNGNEMGRPLTHIRGFSPTCLPSYFLFLIIKDPYRFITVLTLITCFLTDVFMNLLARELRCSHFAGFIAATLISTSPPLLYWTTFNLFIADWGWVAAFFCAINRMAKRGVTITNWSALTFSVYSLLMTSYPQRIVLHGELTVGWVAVLLFRMYKTGNAKKLWPFLLSISAAAVIGAVCASPSYIDIAKAQHLSARSVANPEFLLAGLPKIHSVKDVVQEIVQSTFPELFGNPSASSYPLPYDGLSLPPLLIVLPMLSLPVFWRKTWGWWIPIVASILLTFSPRLYLFGIRFLGLGFSRSCPLVLAILPLTILAAYGADAILRGCARESSTVAATIVMSLLGVALAFGAAQGLAINGKVVAVACALLTVIAVQRIRPSPVLVGFAAAAIGIFMGRPLILKQSTKAIEKTSPAVGEIRRHMPEGSRFAVVGGYIPLLPPDFNSFVGLPSIHSYNSLSPVRYQHLIEILGGKCRTMGRYNSTIGSIHPSLPFYMANVSVVLSGSNLSDSDLTFLSGTAGVNIYAVKNRMGSFIRLSKPEALKGELQNIPAQNELLEVQKTLDKGDLLEFSMPAGSESVLILSQTFNPDWKAYARVADTWKPAETFPVNETFQGVRVPAGSTAIRLAFKPVARFAWIGHIFFGLLAAASLVEWIRRRKTLGASQEFATEAINGARACT